jgi:transposase
MTKRLPEEKPMPTIWWVSDELWEKIEPILAEHDPPKRTGRPRADQRAVLSTPSSSDSGPDGSATGCLRRSSPMTRACIGPSSGGLS